MLARLIRSTRGTAIWEFALIWPLLMTLGFAVWEFGRLTDALIIATNAAREGARYAAAHSTDATLVSDTQSDVWTYLQGSFGKRVGSGGDITSPTSSTYASTITVKFVTPSGSTTSTPGLGDQVTVTVPLTATVYTKFVPGLSGSISLTGTTTMFLQ